MYQKVEEDPITATNKKIHKALDNMMRKKQIDKTVSDYLCIKRPQLGRFYLLPKIHKRTTNVPGRLTTSNNRTGTENIRLSLMFT